LEGLERGPAGNTSLAAAFALAQEMRTDQVIVVQETEYTGAGKHPQAQLTFAKDNGIEVRRGDPQESIPGKNIIIPTHPAQIQVKDIELDHLRLSYLKNVVGEIPYDSLVEKDREYLEAETRWSQTRIKEAFKR